MTHDSFAIALSRPRATHRNSLRVLVLPRPGTRPLFYFEPSLDGTVHGPAASEDPSERGGIRGWSRRVLDRVRHLEEHVPERLRSPILWLKSRLPADERLLMAMRTADAIALVHPSTMSPEEVTGAWRAYLDRRFQRRIAWFVGYLLLLVPSVMMTIIPGPNVLGFWVTYRLVAHGLAMYSLIRASKQRVRVSHEPDEVLDGPIFDDRKEADLIQRHFHLHGLKLRLKRERVLARLRNRKRNSHRSN